MRALRRRRWTSPPPGPHLLPRAHTITSRLQALSSRAGLRVRLDAARAPLPTQQRGTARLLRRCMRTPRRSMDHRHRTLTRGPSSTSARRRRARSASACTRSRLIPCRRPRLMVARDPRRPRRAAIWVIGTIDSGDADRGSLEGSCVAVEGPAARHGAVVMLVSFTLPAGVCFFGRLPPLVSCSCVWHVRYSSTHS